MTTPDVLCLLLGVLAAGAMGWLLAWTLLRARAPGEETAVLSGLRAQVEVLAQGQTTVQQALTTVQGTLGDLQEARRGIDEARTVGRRAREVAQYISPPATLPWTVAAVPDPAYAVCRRAHLEALERTLEDSVARAITMLENAYGDLRRGTGDLRGTLAGLRQPPQTSSDALVEYPR